MTLRITNADLLALQEGRRSSRGTSRPRESTRAEWDEDGNAIDGWPTGTGRLTAGPNRWVRKVGLDAICHHWLSDPQPCTDCQERFTHLMATDPHGQGLRCQPCLEAFWDRLERRT